MKKKKTLGRSGLIIKRNILKTWRKKYYIQKSGDKGDKKVLVSSNVGEKTIKHEL
jgi:hypothetical protein